MKNKWNVKPFKKSKSLLVKPMIPKNLSKKQKDFTFPQAQKNFRLSYFGDYDKDKVLNMFDCRPLDSSRHKVPPKYKTRVVPSFMCGNYQVCKKHKVTFGEVFHDAEEELPQLFKGEREKAYSDNLTGALLERKKCEISVFKNVVGTYKIKMPKSKQKTNIIHKTILNYLKDVYPDRKFTFTADPKYVNVTFPNGSVLKKLKISKYLKKAPELLDLLTFLDTTKELATIVITDYPVDILKKSTSQGWKNCETFEKGSKTKGPFDDIAFRNAVAYIYLGKTPEQGKATGRVMLRWGINKYGKPDIGIESVCYGDGFDKQFFLKAIQDILKGKGYNLTQIITPYYYGGYSDKLRGSGHIEYTDTEYTPSSTNLQSKFLVKLLRRKDLPKGIIDKILVEYIKSSTPLPIVDLLGQHNITDRQLAIVIAQVRSPPRVGNDTLDHFWKHQKNIGPLTIQAVVKRGGSVLTSYLVSEAGEKQYQVIKDLLKKSALTKDQLVEVVDKGKKYEDLVQKYGGVRGLIAIVTYKDSISPSLYKEIIKLPIEGQGELWGILARKPNLPEELQIEIVKRGNDETLEYLMRNESLSGKALILLIEKNPYVFSNLYTIKELDESALRYLFEHSDLDTISRILGNDRSWREEAPLSLAKILVKRFKDGRNIPYHVKDFIRRYYVSRIEQVTGMIIGDVFSLLIIEEAINEGVPYASINVRQMNQLFNKVSSNFPNLPLSILREGAYEEMGKGESIKTNYLVDRGIIELGHNFVVYLTPKGYDLYNKCIKGLQKLEKEG